MVTHIEVVDVSPVGDEHAVPSELFLDPAGEEGLVGMGRDAVDGRGIDHGGQGAGAEAGQERAEEFLAKVVLGDDGRGAVLTAGRHAIAHEMLQGHGAVVGVDMVRVLTLDGDGLDAGHLGLEVGILAEAFPDARPARVAAEVHDRGEHPRALRGTGLIGHRLAEHAGIFAVERRGDIDLLRIEGTVGKVGGTMDHVESIDARDADEFHGLLLDLADHRGGLLAAVGGIVHDIEDGTDLVFAEDLLEFRRVDRLMGLVFQDGNVELD